MQTIISWGDGSGDNIYFTYLFGIGDETVSVSSDQNTSTSSRSKSVTFTAGTVTKTLTVTQAGAAPTEYTVRLVPSAYAVSSTTYLTVADANNMYTNTDSGTYGTVTNTNASTNSRYFYLRGFNIGSIPNNANVTSFTVKIKGYGYRMSTSASYAPCLCNGTSAISGTTASENFGASASVITVPTGALTWTNVKNYGSNFTVRVNVRRSNKNNQAKFYCYGAEIEVKYTL